MPRVQIVMRHLLSGVIQVQRDVQVETSSGHAGLKAAERQMPCTGFLGSPAHVVLKSTDVTRGNPGDSPGHSKEGQEGEETNQEQNSLVLMYM